MNVFQCETGTYYILMKYKFALVLVSEGFHSTLLDFVVYLVQCYELLKMKGLGGPVSLTLKNRKCTELAFLNCFNSLQR